MYERCEDCGARTIKGNHVCLDCLMKRINGGPPKGEAQKPTVMNLRHSFQWTSRGFTTDFTRWTLHIEEVSNHGTTLCGKSSRYAVGRELPDGGIECKDCSASYEEKLTETRSLGYEKGRQQAMADTQNDDILEDTVLIGDSGSDMAEAYDIEHDDKPDFVEAFVKGYLDFTTD